MKAKELCKCAGVAQAKTVQKIHLTKFMAFPAAWQGERLMSDKNAALNVKG